MTHPTSITASRDAAAPPRIYFVHPLAMKSEDHWRRIFHHAHDLGFDKILTAPIFARPPGASVFVTSDYARADPELGLGSDADAALSRLVALAAEEGLGLMLDIVVDVEPDPRGPRPFDPRIGPIRRGGSRLDIADEKTAAIWGDRLARFSALGVSGFRCQGIAHASTYFWRAIIDRSRAEDDRAIFLAWTPGTDFDIRRRLRGAGFDGCFSSFAWWDLEAPWFAEEYELQRDLGWQIAFPEAPYGKRVAHGAESREILERNALRGVRLADQIGDGLMMPMGFEFGATRPLDPLRGDGGLQHLQVSGCFNLTSTIRDLNRAAKRSVSTSKGPLQILAASGTPCLTLLRTEGPSFSTSDRLTAILVNRDLRLGVSAPFNALREASSGFLPLKPAMGDGAALNALARLRPGEIKIYVGERGQPIRGAIRVATADTAVEDPRLAIEAVTPSVDTGRFPVKRIVGSLVRVEADVFGDGHDPLSAALLWRAADEAAWRETPMTLLGNDRWTAEFTPQRLGRHEFQIEAWRNPFAIYRYELQKKHEARLDLTLELQEGAALIRKAEDRADDPLKSRLRAFIERLAQTDSAERVALLLSDNAFKLMADADARPFRTRSNVIPLDAERREAAFASWYQIFPRSQSGDPHRHGTFNDVIRRLPAIRDMGFDVLYFPPIHPIGKTNRKGRNNSLTPAPDDPGSPYAIGSPEGGHDAIHPELGTFEDFRRLVAAARDHGLEIALDLAIQASPDHPWLEEHRGWFDWRPDGTVRYAENPPKKYEDIVNVDFYGPDAAPSLWITLRDIVQTWIDNGVTLFRVDNPHTKPFPFWEWLIADIRNRHPEAVFLSEAFTRPKVMYRLAKIGFSQSYTYFTWRNLKWELEEYMRELTEKPPRDFFRPHFFVNTHDINPDFLQNAPRPAYLIRAALAATLSGLWGVYNGFELCEGRPDAKRKEYADSEKYEIRAWDYDRPGNIKREVALLNRIRRENPALHSHLGLTLLPAYNDNVMFFEKASEGRENVLLIAVSLDPHAPQEADVEIPLWKWNLPDDGALSVEDLIGGHRFAWRGKWQRLRLDPQGLPFSIWRAR
ncbi:starch synthase (maltosyl-transferring) [Rhizobium sp. SG_E_25_P2]|uniref:maltotransferase domain-containing protein n=1 Tax=Rhizobium sp. SG_E_25_P2 TaxID=2879942 RepID=UPI0024765DD0|nr:maltotransferase domain-containing protein [Rhizobium sp. SG_E_25_P2]MDH6264624.1 starch synthase (maltosyl-transferring) [Rhizobium sp. SG_E_25_P2]